ncbi:cytosolic carboxypeptidase 3 isoform X3 [Hippopotamus amphibius kiboko]|uniref:cytosolic carboxypeptidase 3 isoform X3 n=1 Tax=Hippopotamus amphibius kiboko TaxID=575201 RepID=UPI002594F4D9|nr:cytosolic carboxypeptidase 3 isoform X3 [Hippopotamus amphibius kiboko]
MEKLEVILYCDLHGHSKKQNIFMYGCDGSDRCKAVYLEQQIFPLMLSKNCPDKFSFSACKFNIQKSKEGTGRVVMWKMGIRNSFTMETSFCGSTLGSKRGTHFNIKDLELMGYHFCDSLLDYCDPDRTKYYQCLKELEEMEKHINLEKVLDDSDSSLKGITLDLLESSSHGSDSSESNDSQTDLLKLSSQIKNKKKHLKTKKERNSTIASHQNTREEREVCDKGHLVQRHEESNSDVTDLHHNLKSNMKECPSFQSKKAGVNWTDDEKRIYKDKKIAETQEILQYLHPIVSTKNVQTTQIINPRTNFQIQYQLNPSAYINIKKHSTSWTPPRNPPLISQRTLMVSSSERLQSVAQKSFKSLSPLKGPKKRKKHSRVKATKTKDMKPVSSKWEATPSSSQKDADKNLQVEESNQKDSMQTAPHPTKNNRKQPKKKDGQPTFRLKLQRDK